MALSDINLEDLNNLDINDINAVRAECANLKRLSPFVYTHDAEVTYGNEKAEEIPLWPVQVTPGCDGFADVLNAGGEAELVF